MALFISNVWKAQLKAAQKLPCGDLYLGFLAPGPCGRSDQIQARCHHWAADSGKWCVYIVLPFWGLYLLCTTPLCFRGLPVYCRFATQKDINLNLGWSPCPALFFLRSFHSSANRSWGLFHRTPCPEELRTTHKSSPRYILIQATKAKIGDANICKPHTKHHISPHPHTNETLWDTSTQHPTVVSLFSICSLWV